MLDMSPAIILIASLGLEPCRAIPIVFALHMTSGLHLTECDDQLELDASVVLS